MDLLCTLVAAGVLAFVAALIGRLRTSVATLNGSVLAVSSSVGGLIGQSALLPQLQQLKRRSIPVLVLSSAYQLDHSAPVLLQQFLFTCLAH